MLLLTGVWTAYIWIFNSYRLLWRSTYCLLTIPHTLSYTSPSTYKLWNILDSTYHNILHDSASIAMSRFVENLEDVPITHPHLNVSLEDILAEEGRKRSTSQSSDTTRSGSDSTPSPTSPTSPSKMDAIRRRAFTLGSKKGRRES